MQELLDDEKLVKIIFYMENYFVFENNVFYYFYELRIKGKIDVSKLIKQLWLLEILCIVVL